VKLGKEAECSPQSFFIIKHDSLQVSMMMSIVHGEGKEIVVHSN